MKPQNPTKLPAYEKAHAGGVFLPQAEAGYLHIEGPDQIDFLQRQTCNDLNLLTGGRSLVTVLLNPAARILDVLRLIKNEDALGALTLPGNAAETTRFLQSRIFFMDQVSVSDQSADYYQVDLFGAEAHLILKRIGFSDLLGGDQIIRSQIAGAPVQAIGQKGFPGLSFRLIAPADAGQDLESALKDADAEVISEDVYHVLRVESGLPSVGGELTGTTGELSATTGELTVDYTPLETGLAEIVSTTKGCYPGQEVIARQINYDKITRSLVGLRLEGPAQPGATITVDGKANGTVTSYAHSPRFGSIALGILKRPFNQPGMMVVVSEASGDREIPAQVTSLPFDLIEFTQSSN